MLLESLLEPTPPCISSRLHIMEVRKLLYENPVLVVVDEFTNKARGTVHAMTALNLKNGRADNALLLLPTYTLRDNPFLICNQIGNSPLEHFLIAGEEGRFYGLVSLSRLKRFCQAALAAQRAADELERLQTAELTQVMQDALLLFDHKGRLLWASQAAEEALRHWRLTPQEVELQLSAEAMQTQDTELSLLSQGMPIPLQLRLIRGEAGRFRVFGRLIELVESGTNLGGGQPLQPLQLLQVCNDLAEQLARHLEFLKNLETVMAQPQVINESLENFVQRQRLFLKNLHSSTAGWLQRLHEALPRQKRPLQGAAPQTPTSSRPES